MVLEFLYFGYSPAKNKLRISQPVSQKKVHCILCTPLTKFLLGQQKQVAAPAAPTIPISRISKK